MSRQGPGKGATNGASANGASPNEALANRAAKDRSARTGASGDTTAGRRGGTLHSVIVDHDTSGARTIGRANNPDAGIIVAAVPPESRRRRYELSWGLLEGLGKRQDVTGNGRNDDENWEILHAWLLAHRIAHVVLLDAQWLAPELVEDVAGLAATCGLDMWLVAHHPVPEAHIDAIARWPHETGTQRGLAAAVKRSLAAAPVPAPDLDVAAFPDVVNDNWPTFRHACRQRLDPADFAVIDASYRAAFRAARSWFTGGDPVTEDTVLRHVRHQLNACVTVPEMVTTVRATQVAAWRSGWLLQADPARLVRTAEEMSRAAIHSPVTWRRLRAYRAPYRGAAVALAAADLTVGAMLDLVCGDVSADGTTVTSARVEVAVPAGAEVYLRAQAAYRNLQGAAPDEPLFADDDILLSDRTLASALLTPATEVGVPVNDLATSRRRVQDNARWRYRWGLSVQRLPT